jgi:hypothetical protein
MGEWYSQVNSYSWLVQVLRVGLSSGYPGIAWTVVIAGTRWALLEACAEALRHLRVP